MYGQYRLPVDIDMESISLSLKKIGDKLLYRRIVANNELEKLILADECMVLINPIEPVNTPKEITHYLLIEFEKPMIIEPEGIKKVYIRFPVEIGIFIGKDGGKEKEVLDIFSLSSKKYILYGEIQQGVLCKYFKSDIYTEFPSIDILKEGVIELEVFNRTGSWININKTVFDAHHMKIYYDDTLVSMKSQMIIVDEGVAEIAFMDSPIKADMKKSLELYVSRRMPILSAKFLMEWGL